MVRLKRFRRLMAVALIAALTWTTLGVAPVRADGELPSKATLVGDLQTELGAAGDWAPTEAATDMTDQGGGNYTFTGTLPPGTYEYKVALNGTWTESYGFSSYTKPNATNSGGNIVLTLTEETTVTFYYNHATKKIADSTYYAPLASDKQPRVAGTVQTAVGESSDWNPATSTLLLKDDDYDNVYKVTANVPKGNYEYKVVLGSSWGQDYPGQNATLVLPQDLPVTFSYNKATNEVKGEFTVPAPADPVPDGHLRIHYKRTAGDYEAFGLWLWEHVAAPSTNWPKGATPFPAEKRDDYGAYIDVKLAPDASKVGFLVLNLTTEVKDGGDKSVVLTTPDMNEVWIKQGDDKVYSSPSGEVAKALLSAEIVSDNELLLGFTTTEGLNADVLLEMITVEDGEGEPLAIKSAAVQSGTSVSLAMTENIDLERVPLAVHYNGLEIAANVGWRMIDSKYAYSGNDLGATYAGGSATLKLWAPKASEVTANFYDKNDAASLVGSVDLALNDYGVWSATVNPSDMTTEGIEDLRGYYYQYEVTNDGVTKKVLDPYAKSMAEFRVNTAGEAGADGDTVGKAAIVELSGTDPAGFGYADIDGYEKREDAIIWEAHIRDFTSDPSIEDDLTARFGSYKAFIDKLPYIQSLGVTHIQLLPVMAWYYGDELAMDEREMEYSAGGNEYNWGYDPHSYFSPDGAYSLDAKDPELRVQELKELIDAIHDAGMGVVLDVVYTHMAKADFLNDIVPNYYAFQDASGKFLGDFGNNLATNRAMAEKLMVDSVKYWFDEYKIDGMRWDMMGDASYPAVQKAYDAAEALNQNALFIGEGWRTFKGNQADPSLAGMGADQDWMNKTDSVGVFSDEIRNELKSGYGSEGEPRFITGGARNIETILNNIKGQPGNVNEDDPGDIVPYIEAHDNLPLYDVIAQSIKKDPAIADNNLEIHKRIRLGNLIMMTSQGTSFLHAGQEYGRTKQWLGEGVPVQKYHALEDAEGNVFGYFVHDSYDSSDAINKFDWAKATDEAAYPVNHVTSDYTKGLIELRKSTDAFRLGDQDLVNSNVTLIDAPEMADTDLVIGYKNVAMDGSGHYYVFINADDKNRTLTLSEDLTDGTVVVDNDEAGTAAVTTASGFTLTAESITIEPLGAVVIRMDAEAPEMVSILTDDSERELAVDETSVISVYAQYEGGSREKVRSGAGFVSSNPKVASVTSAGKMTAMGVGHARITVTYAGYSAIVDVEVQEANAARVVQFNYIRPDGNYANWNIWVWNTGETDGQILFERIESGVATAMIEVNEDATGVGFVLRKGTDWNTAKQDIGYDRMIPLAGGDRYTKVDVRSMVGELDIFPTIDGPYLLDGDITFRYRDESLFRQGLMDTINGVQVKVADQSYEMVYDPVKEWYEYTLQNVEPDSYEYSFLVTREGETIERNDPTNTVGGKSVIVYREPEVTLSGSVEPGAIHYDENAVLRVSAQTSEPLSFREGQMDLSALDGEANAPFNTELMAHTIAVKDSVTAGVKEIPITLVDQYGNTYEHKVSVTVEARTFAGELDFDFDESRIYFLLTDRFEDGDETNNANVDTSHPEAYHGGDFKGLIEKLPYLDELGINTLWITPIVDNIDFNKGVDFNAKQYGYHGYWAKDFTALDEHLGDMDTFKKLIEEAHDRGMKIMVDVVLNHTGYGLKPDDNREGITEEDKARFADMLRTNGLSADINPTKGELQFLPDLITENAEVREQIIEWQAGWLNRAKTDRGDTIDFFRVDTVKHVEATTWVAFKNALTEIDPSFKLIGEYFGGTVEGDGGMLDSGQMDALLDFGFKEHARDFANGSIDEVDAYLQDRESKLSNTKTMGQFLSSHDENGFLSHYVGGDKSKLMIAAALQITAKGMPVVYYGEELGQSGANAGDMSQGQFSGNRDDMPWDKLEEEAQLHEHYKKLLNIRAKYSKVYAKGERTKLAGSDELGYLAFNKSYSNENIVTIINTNDEAVSVSLNVPFAAGTTVEDEYSGRTYTVSADGKLVVQVPSRAGGGTAILSDDVTSLPPVQGGNTQAPQWPGVEQVSAGELADGKDGKATVELETGSMGAVLPMQAASLLGANDLEIVTGDLTIVLPQEALAAAANLLPANERTSDAFILFRAKPLTSDELEETLEGYESQGVRIKQGGTVYDFRIAVVKGGQEVGTVSQFERPVSVSFELNEGMNEDTTGIYYISDEGDLFYVGGQLQDGVMTAELSHFSAYGVLEIDRSFSDLPAGHWAEAAVKSLAAKGIVAGMDGQRFAPDADVTRAQFAKMLVSALLPGMEPAEAEGIFTDVPADAWFAPYVEAAYELGIAGGRGDGRFDPAAAITREEMAAMLIRAYRPVIEADDQEAAEAPSFTDLDRISEWALQDVSAAVELGLVKGRADGSFSPREQLSRAESAQAVYNLLKAMQ